MDSVFEQSFYERISNVNSCCVDISHDAEYILYSAWLLSSESILLLYNRKGDLLWEKRISGKITPFDNKDKLATFLEKDSLKRILVAINNENDHKIHMFDIGGKTLWEEEYAGEIVTIGTGTERNGKFLVALSAELFMFDFEGNQEWKFITNLKISNLFYNHYIGLVTNDKMESVVYTIEPVLGREINKMRLSGSVSAISFDTQLNNIALSYYRPSKISLFQTSNGKIGFFKKPKWEFMHGKETFNSNVNAQDKNRILFFSDNEIFCFDLDGNLKWTYKAGRSITDLKFTFYGPFYFVQVYGGFSFVLPMNIY